ncbi:MAG: winged helix-turn-helix transcriptional regulator [Fibrobacteres bacterium]|nr:winged helix-turn-helix transcriptional regulator [Fibrobacterota bacterium]
MAMSKKEEFSKKDQLVAEFAKVFSHPARVAILRTLARKGTCICGDLVEVLPLAQSTVSQHLRELKDAGVIIGEIDGTKSCYCIDRSALKQAWEAFGEIFRELERNYAKNCC